MITRLANTMGFMPATGVPVSSNDLLGAIGNIGASPMITLVPLTKPTGISAEAAGYASV